MYTMMADITTVVTTTNHGGKRMVYPPWGVRSTSGRTVSTLNNPRAMTKLYTT